MNLSLTLNKKRIVIAVEILLVLFFCINTLLEILVPKYTDAERVKFAYTSKANIDYRVYLRPNIIYRESFLEKGRYYILKYIDHVNLNMKYDFISSDEADLTAVYSVTAYLQGLHGEENEVLWSREYILIPEKTIHRNSSDLSIELSENVSLSEFLQVRESFYLESEVNSPAVLNVVFSVHTKADSKEGTLEDNLKTNLIIPIGNNVFKIEGTPEARGENRIPETIRNRIPVNYLKVAIFLVISLLLVVLVILTIRYVKTAEPPDPFNKAIADIFKEYSERLAGMTHSISYHFSDVITVNSIEDMIKIADEIGQPVFYYKVDNKVERKIEFFVFDSGRVYYMAIFGEIKPESEESSI
ncbi:MAG TPA: DUF5305 domain-containing protein [Clostridiaceae bacterium]|nr:DUF5305 domain-containing protein [Clostridiaceae bacterium]